MPKLLLVITLCLIPLLQMFSQVYHIQIEGTIDLGLPPYIERTIEEAGADDAQAIILEINTFGGRLDAATQIKDILLNTDIRTIAFINKRAISAGALISLSCDEIAMVPGSSMGAATVVDQSGQKASEKMISYFRTEMGATAEQNGRNRLIAEGMVDEDVEVEGLSQKGKLITLTAEDAIKWDMAEYIAPNLAAVLDSTGLAGQEIITSKISWAERLVRFLTDPLISSLLISFGLLGLFFEIKSPGFGFPGTIGLIFLGLFFGSHYIVDLANIIEIILFIAGITLLLVEIFVIPGFGIAGVGGILLMMTGLYLSLIGNWKHVSLSDMRSAAAYMSLSFIITFMGVVAILRVFPKTFFWKRISLEEVQERDQGYIASRDYSKYLGLTGIALSTLRPSGIGLFEGERLDVVSDGDYIEKDTPIIITRIDGYRLIVRPISKESQTNG
ncbi:MAG: nodulation protein NfeD [Calditrichaeota bacterium]|nr:MAG: nodulation protein NfeD [Calditrichota bacterium]